ncbi:Stk1 family PASTA domain-containing Ser/Thr kinase [Gephyromycinifex aptenodytis]|uniref:Stk1 family PASTA domain-containing Ser/Thr kinase n=1 Tax=Gephyromycinifex aptenodytis TaxID=2716227 RepID=UPI001448090A|nr:Stk1 family PASTA domain-containing Ser/Thr kinase [Gephyromycinifex aptenodytis]
MAYAPQEDSLVDRTLDGRYLVREHIADGGMGSVYIALDTRLDRDVALKIMRPELARDPEFVERFRSEARAAARLTHPNAVAVYDQGEDDKIVFLAMELVEGRTLRAWLRQVGALTPREALEVTEAVLSALNAAHARGIVHRDIKPENVLIAADGHVKVADFGLARAVTATTATGLSGPLLGTVAYLSPEQVEHGSADERSDLYAVGLLLHELLTGRPAVDGPTPINIAWQHVNGTVPPPSAAVAALPPELDDITTWATQRDPADRPSTAGALLERVRAALDTLPDEVLDRRPEPAAPTQAGQTPAPGHDTGTIKRHTRVIPRAHGATASTAKPAAAPPTRAVVEPGESAGAAAPRKRARSGPLVLLLLLAAALITAGGYWFFGPPSARVLPELTGLQSVQAQDSLTALDLRPNVEDGYSEEVPRGQVIASDPSHGSSLRRGDEVLLVVSKGPERYDVPDLAGMTVAQAGAALKELKLSLGAQTPSFSEKVPAGKVISSEPATGTTLRPGTAVKVTVSKGRQPVAVGDWVGTSLEDVQAELEERGLKISVAGTEFSSRIDKGAVLSQQPADGTLFKGDTVTVTVSKGPDLVKVPNVRGETSAEAKAALESAGFSVKINRIAGGLFGTAHSTVPAAGKGAPRGGTVVLNVV